MSHDGARQGVVLVVMDGIGNAPPGEGNAVSRADTPILDRLFADYPYTELSASGPAVGLPDGYIGNSEVGHLHIGAGRVIPQELVRINKAIADGSFFTNQTLEDAAAYAREHDSTVHVMGIASDGGVHGHIDHMKALIRCFAEKGCEVRTHAFLDGRDVGPKTADRYLADLEETADKYGTGHIASFMGRYYAMDRDNNWQRTQEAYNCLVRGEGRKAADTDAGLEEAYRNDRNDYFVNPTIIDEHSITVSEHDVVVVSNYRKDRARQLTSAFVTDFDRFPTTNLDLRFVTMMRYKDSFDNPVVFDRFEVEHTLGDIISEHGMAQLRVTESQKEPHVTYFLNGQREADIAGEDVHIFPSAKVASYDEKPEMEAETITDDAVSTMENEEYEFLFINYPNCDLVGHTGDIDAAITAVETVDAAVGRLVDAAREHGYALVLTSDHGTCETMLDEEGNMHTAHTLNSVPFCIVDDTLQDVTLRDGGGLANIAATVLDLLDLPADEAMDASLIP